MSIQIQNDSLSGAVSPAVGGADEISRAARSPSPSSTSLGSRGVDKIDISSFAQNVAAASSAQDAQQASRIKQLTAIYRSGQYSVDSAQVSRAMVSQALGDGPIEKS